MYKQQFTRENEKVSFENIDDYLRSLKLGLTIYIDEIKFVARIAQLTQKQISLT